MQRTQRRHRPARPRRFEEFAYVLDYKPLGNPTDRHPQHRSMPIVQLIGEDYFMLLEGIPRKDAEVEIGERVYIGPIERLRLKIHHIDAEITYDDLTSIAREALPEILKQIIRSKEQLFIEFYNMADAITIRLHSLELLPGIGKKTVIKIIEQRSIKPFTSFDDIKNRVGIDPLQPLVERIILELQGKEKYYLFLEPRKLVRDQVEKPIFLNYLERIQERLRQQQST
ncbi:MAG: DUF655 domain-containing protein [Pyrodictiaceae archaeon]